MNLHEFQAKDLFRDYGISVSKGVPIRELSEVRNAIKSLNGDKWVMKVQVHAGGRGKAGGVELVSSIEEAEAFVEKWLGKNLVTFQTDEKGQPINPLQKYYNILDTKNPIPNSLAFIPIDSSAYINGKQEYTIYNLDQYDSSRYILKDTVSAIGNFGLAIDVSDEINNQPFNYKIK